MLKEKKTINIASTSNRESEQDPARALYKIYEYDDGLYFPDMKFRCGSLENYVRTGILSEAEVEEIWNENASLK